MGHKLRLVELEPQFLRYEEREEAYKVCHEDHVHNPECGEVIVGPRVYFPYVDALAEAQGLKFLCPKCFAQNGEVVGTHSVVCWSRSRGVPEHAVPSGRWRLDGTGYGDLTLNADPPSSARSVLLVGGCAWHGFVTDGEVT